jgi:hypothetical protein
MKKYISLSLILTLGSVSLVNSKQCPILTWDDLQQIKKIENDLFELSKNKEYWSVRFLIDPRKDEPLRIKRITKEAVFDEEEKRDSCKYEISYSKTMKMSVFLDQYL